MGTLGTGRRTLGTWAALGTGQGVSWGRGEGPWGPWELLRMRDKGLGDRGGVFGDRELLGDKGGESLGTWATLGTGAVLGDSGGVGDRGEQCLGTWWPLGTGDGILGDGGALGDQGGVIQGWQVPRGVTSCPPCPQSTNSGRVLAPGPFLVRDDHQERHFGFSLAQALQRARRHPLLQVTVPSWYPMSPSGPRVSPSVLVLC